MIIEVLDKHYGGLTTLKNVIDWCGTIDKTNADNFKNRYLYRCSKYKTLPR